VFSDQDSAVRHMVNLFAAEARNLGHTLSESDLDLLARQCPLPWELEFDAKEIITQLLAKEELQAEADGCEDPQSFSNTLEWANEPMYPNIARITEDVVSGKTREAKLHVWPRVVDTVLLVLSALGVVILMMVVGYFFSK
jgi:hypothetical protein